MGHSVCSLGIIVPISVLEVIQYLDSLLVTDFICTIVLCIDVGYRVHSAADFFARQFGYREMPPNVVGEADLWENKWVPVNKAIGLDPDKKAINGDSNGATETKTEVPLATV